MEWGGLLCREGCKPPGKRSTEVSRLFFTVLSNDDHPIQFMPTMVYFHVSLQGPTVIPNNWYGKRWLRPVDVPDVGNTGGKLECRLPNAHNSVFESYFRITFALLCSSFPLNYWLLKIQAVLLGHTNMHPPIALVTIHNSQLHVLS